LILCAPDAVQFLSSKRNSFCMPGNFGVLISQEASYE
jgi:hypothetical protein